MARRSTVHVLMVLAAAAAAGTLTAAPPPAASQLPTANVREELIGELSPGAELASARSAGDHLAWVQKAGGKKTVWKDGKPVGPAYDDVNYLAFSRDLQHLTWIAKRKSSWVLVVDGVDRSPEYGSITSPVFSANGRFFAAGACRAKTCHLIVNGDETGPAYEDISFPRFSPSGAHYAYLGKRSKMWRLVVDGGELGPEMDDATSWNFGPSECAIVAALIDGKWSWVVDGRPGPGFDAIGGIDFTGDGVHYTYGGSDANWGFSKKQTHGSIVVDGEILKSFEGSGFAGGWQTLFGRTTRMVTGLVRLSADFHGVSSPFYTTSGMLVYAARVAEDQISVFTGESTGPGFEDLVSSIAVTPDGRHTAYIVKRGDQFVEVRDHQPGASFPGERAVSLVEFIVMSRDGDHLAYEIVRGGSQFKNGQTTRAQRRIVLDGGAGVEYDALGIANFTYSGNGLHHYYEVIGAKDDRDLVVLDGKETRLYDAVFRNSTRTVDEQTIEFVAQDGRKFLRVMASGVPLR